MEFPIHWLIVLALLGIVVGIPLFAYRHGRKVGDQEDTFAAYKEGQQSQVEV